MYVYSRVSKLSFVSFDGISLNGNTLFSSRFSVMLGMRTGEHIYVHMFHDRCLFFPLRAIDTDANA